MFRCQRCLTAACVGRQADADAADFQSTSAVCELGTKKADVDEKRVQRSDGHFDLLGMQIFLYKGRTFAERYFGYLITSLGSCILGFILSLGLLMAKRRLGLSLHINWCFIAALLVCLLVKLLQRHCQFSTLFFHK